MEAMIEPPSVTARWHNKFWHSSVIDERRGWTMVDILAELLATAARKAGAIG